MLCLGGGGQGSPAKGVQVEGRKGPQLELLNGINGAFRPKVLTALMGVTGAGKTTLMDCLAGRKTSASPLLESFDMLDHGLKVLSS